MIKNCSLKNAFQKLFFQKTISILLPLENAFQKHAKLHPQKIYFKNTCQIAPSRNVIQKRMSNCYIKDIFISGSINAVKTKLT